MQLKNLFFIKTSLVTSCFLLFIIAALGFNNAVSATEYPTGICEGDCKNGFGIAYFTHDSSIKYYEGNWKDGMKEGKGTLYHASGTLKYEGLFQADMEAGQGIQYDEKTGAKIYEGEWLNGLRHGKGKQYWANGDFYEGEFVNGLKNGQGTYVYANKAIAKGVWKNNVLIGENSIAKTSENRLSAPVEHIQSRCLVPGDCKNGYGVFVFDDGRRYEGNFKNAKFEGKGSFFNAEGKLTYEGQWANNKRQGHGVSYNPYTGKKEYEGNWQEDVCHGKGKLYSNKSDKVYDTVWNNGEMTLANGKPIVTKVYVPAKLTH